MRSIIGAGVVLGTLGVGLSLLTPRCASSPLEIAFEECEAALARVDAALTRELQSAIQRAAAHGAALRAQGRPGKLAELLEERRACRALLARLAALAPPGQLEEETQQLLGELDSAVHNGNQDVGTARG